MIKWGVLTFLLLLASLPAHAEPTFLAGMESLSQKAQTSANELSIIYTQYEGAGKTTGFWGDTAEGGPFDAPVPQLSEAEFRARVTELRASKVLLCMFHTHPFSWPQEIAKLSKEEIKERGWEEYLAFLNSGMKSIPPGGGDSMVELAYASSMEQLLPGIKARDQLGVIDASGVWYYSHYKPAEKPQAERQYLAALSKDSALALRAKALQSLKKPLDVIDAARKPWMLHVNRPEITVEAALSSPWYAFLRYGYAKAGIRLGFVSRGKLAGAPPCVPNP